MFRAIREGLRQLWRNRFLSWSTLGLGALIIFLLNIVLGLQYFADYSLQNLEARADFSVPLRENYEPFDLESLQNEVKTKEVSFQVLPGQNDALLQIPSRLLLKFGNLREVESVFEILKKPRYDTVVSTWDFEGEREFTQIIHQLLRVRDGVTKLSWGLVMIFLIGGILMIINTFRMVLFSRKEEIFIARLVGAKPNFIASPFWAEGFLLGFCASFIGIIIFVLVLREIELLPGAEIFIHLWNTAFAWEMILAGCVGTFGAWWSVRKYLFGRYKKS